MRVKILFMPPITVKYLPFCRTQLSVSLQCDKRFHPPSLNPFLLCPISSRSLPRTVPACSVRSFSASLFRGIPSGTGGAFDQVSDTFQDFILEHVCVFRVCISFVICLTFQLEEKQYMCALKHFICECGTAG